MEGLKVFLNISGQVSSAAIPRPETIIGVAVEIFSVLGLGEQTGLIFGRILSFVYLAVCLILFFRRKYTWKLLWLISSLMVIFVNLSYEKEGFKVEGRMEDEMFLDGKYENLIFMAVVKKDEM